MRKHIYLHTSHLEKIAEIKEDEQFEPVYEYAASVFAKAHQNEFGRIKTNQNYYHILIGQMKQSNCVWCGHGCTIEKTGECKIMGHNQYSCICINCGSRGPILNVRKELETDEIAMQNYWQFIKQRFETRRQWDCGLINEYEQDE